ncbi:MAG: diphosphomevalonate decarboxylase [Chloroflexi bacterium]|nr:diphosphomevalonate decarboxylase [Chloroflexota bacterium]
MPDRKATCVAFSNIALIKYWGNRDNTLRLPMNGSLSFTLDGAYTITTVEFGVDLPQDTIELDGAVASGPAAERISRHLDLMRTLAGVSSRARVASRNNFPTGAGIASSASGFAALTCAAAWALGLNLSDTELSRWARRGSGSAARSIGGGFVEWHASDEDAQSYAEVIAPAQHWPLHDLIAVVARGQKAVGSTEGHSLAHTSPLYAGRIAQVENDLPVMRRAILERDFQALGEIAEADALSMHAVMMTSRPSLIYWTPETVTVMRAVREWRRGGLACYFTIDAGPNVHVITTREAASEARYRLQQLTGVERIISCQVGPGARQGDESLF